MLHVPPATTPFPTRRSSDLCNDAAVLARNLFVAIPTLQEIHSPISSLIRCFISDRKRTRLNSSHTVISYAVLCLKNKNTIPDALHLTMNERQELTAALAQRL